PWLTSTRSADNCSQLVRGTCCDRSREPQMPAATCEQPTTRREVAFKPDGRRLHLKQSLRLKLCRASLGRRHDGEKNSCPLQGTWDRRRCSPLAMASGAGLRVRSGWQTHVAC